MTQVECAPIRHVLSLPNHDLIVFGDFTSFVAYETTGRRPVSVRWRSVRLGWDDLEVMCVTADRIEGHVWDAPAQQEVGYSVDIRSGKHEGSAYEDLRGMGLT